MSNGNGKIETYVTPQVAPHSKKAEEALLGSILINSNAFSEVNSYLTHGDFSQLKCDYVWEAMVRLFERGDVIEYLTVIEELRTQERLDDIGGSAYLTLLASQIVTSVHAWVYAQIVARMAVRRRGLEAVDKIASLMRDEESDIEDVLNRAQAEWNKVTFVLDSEPTMEEISEDVWTMYGQAAGRPWCVPAMTAKLGGLGTGQLIIVTARTKGGKSRLCVQQSLEFLQAKKRVLFMTTEMSRAEIQLVFAEMISTTGFSLQNFKNKNITPEQKSELLEMQVWLEASSLTILRINGWSAEKVAERINKYPAGTYDLVIVDSISRLGKSSEFQKVDHTEIGFRALTLKNASQDAETCIIAPAQLNRESVKSSRIGTEHIAGSDGIAAEADLILSIERPDRETKPDEAIIGVLESRSGIAGVGSSIPVGWDTTKGMFKMPKYQVDEEDYVFRGSKD